MARLAKGSVIGGRYRLDRCIGEGGMGVVWAATHTVTRRAFALKFVRGPAHVRGKLRKRLLREARAMARIEHPNVVSIIDVFDLDEETPVMVMDLLLGETLREKILREAPLSLAETASILSPVVSAVGTAHARGIIHRDLKPENVFLMETAGGREPRVLDFGLAKLAGMGPEGGDLTTAHGATLGTPCYMAPEQALGAREADHRADVWSVGVILYECLTGARPIEGENLAQVTLSLISTGIMPVERIVPDLPSEVSDLVGRALSREAQMRPADLREVHSILSRFADAVAPPFGAPGTNPAALTIDQATLPVDGSNERRGGAFDGMRRVGLFAIAAVTAVGALASARQTVWSPRVPVVAVATATSVPVLPPALLASSSVPLVSASIGPTSAAESVPQVTTLRDSKGAKPQSALNRLRRASMVATAPAPSASSAVAAEGPRRKAGLAEHSPY